MSRPPENQSSPSSSSSRPTDPFELWRQIYETNERAWNAVLERTVNNPAFAESSGKILETFLSAQKTVRDNMRSYLEQINLPTREDIARLGELIVALEEKVDQLDDRLANLERSASAATTESAKLGDQLGDRLTKLEGSVSAATTASAKMGDQLGDRVANLERSISAATIASAQAGESISTTAKPPTGRRSTRSAKDSAR
jgi:polyhydroxyalkanoic acid synthase PhaR subunit